MTSRDDEQHLAELNAAANATERSRVAVIAASRAPALVVQHAAEWFTPDDEAAAVLVALANHWHRIAFAGALAPWRGNTPDSVRDLARSAGWPEQDLASVLRAMTGTDPILNRPAGIEDRDRWKIIAGEPYRYALWRSDRDAHAIEVVVSGWSGTVRSRLISEAEAASVRAGDADAIQSAIDATGA